MAAARAFSDNDPYRLAGVFSDATIRPWRSRTGTSRPSMSTNRTRSFRRRDRPDAMARRLFVVPKAVPGGSSPRRSR